jgi:peptidoglycan/LPS O-acetylase OafA/YrhL
MTANGAHIGAATFLANLTMVQGTFGFDHIGFGYWTLNLEIVFYVTCAALFARGKLGDVNLIGTLVLAGLGIALSPYAIRAMTGHDGFVTEFPFYLALFLTGLLLRRAHVDSCVAARVWLRGLVPLVLVVGTALGGWYFPVFMNGQPFFAPLPMGLGMALPLALFIAVLARRPSPPRAVLWLGTISYSLYLFQDAGLHGMAAIVDPGASPVTYTAGVIAICVTIAIAVFRIVEQPMIAKGRRLTAQRAASVEVPVAG